jgi:hypothetical protein
MELMSLQEKEDTWSFLSAVEGHREKAGPWRQKESPPQGSNNTDTLSSDFPASEEETSAV